LVSQPQCERCKALEDWLEAERVERKYFQELLLTKAGIIRNNEEISEMESFPSIHKINTLSSLRKAAQDIIVKRHDAEIRQELPEAVSKFEAALNKAN